MKTTSHLLHLRLALAFVVLGCWLGTATAFASNPVPTVTAPVQPQAVIPGSGAFLLTVYGANFVSGAVVNWNGSPRSTTFVSARELQAKILAADVARPTGGYITVTNPPPGGGNSSSSYAIVEVHTPTKTIVPGPPHDYLLQSEAFESLSTGFFHNASTLDLLGGAASKNVYLFIGNADGTFSDSVVGNGYYGDCNLSVGDFNNDGKLDYLFPIGIYQGPARVEVRLGNGKGGFRTSWKHGNFQLCPYTAVGDFNRDGNLDFVAADGADDTNIFLGNGDGTFRQGAVLKEGAINPVVGDFNGDGKLDLVVESAGRIQLLLGNGDGTFQNPRTVFPAPEGCGYGFPMVVDDFNRDGNLDLAFCHVVSVDGTSQIVVSLGNGDGTFKKPKYFHAGSSDGTWAFAAGDFTSDGITDFIVWYSPSPYNRNYFAILKGNGDGTFQRETNVKLPDNMEELQIVSGGDFNSDGLLDFIMIPLGGIQDYLQK
jgi:hypothetical protein